jgi:hypothetical protein
MTLNFDVRRIVDRLSLFPLLGALLVLAACSKLVYAPAPVVPTPVTFPYSATVILEQVEAYTVQPGSTMIADPALADYVTGINKAVGSARADWEQAILRYLAERKTFKQVSTSGPSDIELVMHVNIYLDHSVHFQFKRIYIARVHAVVRDSQTHAPLVSYNGQGKAPQDRREDDQEPINQAVQMALNDLFGKMEQDSYMLRL